MEVNYIGLPVIIHASKRDPRNNYTAYDGLAENVQEIARAIDQAHGQGYRVSVRRRLPTGEWHEETLVNPYLR